MTDSTDYRMYLEEKFTGITKLVNAQFLTVHDRLEAIEVQTTKTNGTVQEHEKILRENLPHSVLNCPQADKIEEIEKVLVGEEAVQRQSKKDKDDIHAKRVRVLMILGIIVTIAISVLNTFAGRAKLDALKNEVDMINTPVKTRGGTIMWYPSGVVIDSLKKTK
jgi:hypothetical protein